MTCLSRIRLSVIAVSSWAMLCGATASDVSPEWQSLSKGVTSFGAEVLDGWVYIYGGHVGKAHDYSVDTTLGDFKRLRADGSGSWESLGGGSRAQGARLVAYEGSIYRLGGLQPRDETDGQVGLYSLNEFARYDASKNQWIQLAPMPGARSSHEVVRVGSKIYVGGGWKMEGEAGGKFWYDTMFVVDLSQPKLSWKSVPQPFKRRALSADAVNGKIYFIGGMDDDNDPSREVNVYDTNKDSWEEGPMIPSGPMQGFGSAACVLDGILVVSPYSASVLTLNVAANEWEPVAKLAQRRFFHRIVPLGKDSILAIAGASRRDGHLASIEQVDFDARTVSK